MRYVKWQKKELWLIAAPLLVLIMAFGGIRLKSIYQQQFPPPPKRVPKPWQPRKMTEIWGHWHWVALSPDGRILATAATQSEDYIQIAPNRSMSSSYLVRLWDVKTGKLKHSLARQRYVSPIKFSRDGKYLVVGWSGPNGKHASVYDARNGRLIRILPPGSGDTQFDISPDSKLLVSSSYSDRVEIRDLQTGVVKNRIKLEPDQWGTATFSPDGQTLVIGCQSQDELTGDTVKLKIWDIPSRSTWRTITIRAALLRDMAFSPDGKTLACGFDRTSGERALPDEVVLWDTKHWRKTATLKQSTECAISSLAFSPDGKRLAVAGYQDGVSIWSLQTNKRLRTYGSAHNRKEDAGSTESVTFSSDGKSIIAGNYGYLRFWPEPENRSTPTTVNLTPGNNTHK